MPSRKKRQRNESQKAAEDGEDKVEPSAKKTKWKPVQMNVDILKEFEGEGGFMIEEADEEIGVVYGDAGGKFVQDEFSSQAKKATAAKTPKPEVKVHGTGESDENQTPRSKKKKKGKHDEQLKKEEKEEKVDGKESKGRGADDEPKVAPADEGNNAKVDASSDALPAWASFDLHPSLLAGIAHLGFRTPTDVQSRCLAPAIRQRKDIVGAAETGSGKTLAFGLPILHHTLEALDSQGEGSSSDELRALIILPTRELAVQVQNHFRSVSNRTAVRVECVVGGMSLHKQKRLLSKRPQVVVGTPGRMSALLGLSKDETDKHAWLRDGLRGLRHLVLDEADRLVEAGHFRELDRILTLVYESVARPQQLQTMVFSATLTLDPRSARHRAREGDEGGKVGALMQRLKFREARAVHIVDLTKPEAARDDHGRPQVGPEPSQEGRKTTQLPDKLVFREAVFAKDNDRETLLVMWLLRRYRWEPLPTGLDASTASTSSSSRDAKKSGPFGGGGRVVLFVNAVSSVLRLSSILALLMESPSARKVLAKVKMSESKQSSPGVMVEVLGLHSKMRQKDRLKKMEKFRSSKHAVLVCTDIAARGLDVPNVAAVIHYQAPRGAEVFVHRSGRTARAGQEGESIAFMGPQDAALWTRVYRAVGIEKDRVEDLAPNAFELQAAREASRLAADLELQAHREGKRETDKSWLRNVANEADLMLEEDEDDGEIGKAMAPKKALWGLYQQLQARVRRPPRRQGAGPLPRRPPRLKPRKTKR